MIVLLNFFHHRIAALSRHLAALFACAALGVCPGQAATASAPAGLNFVDGSGSSARRGDQITWTVSDRATVRIDGLDLSLGQSLIIHQPSNFSVLRIEVEGHAPVRIEGAIAANGGIILTSEAGFEIGESGSVEADGLEFDSPAGQMVNGGSLISRRAAAIVRSGLIQQLGAIEAAGRDGAPATIRLEAGRDLHLGARSRLGASGERSDRGQGGRVWLKASRRFNDEPGSRIDVRGGELAGDAGTVNICAPQVSAIRSHLDGSARPGWRGGNLSIDPTDIILSNFGTDSAGSGSVLAGDSPDTLRLNVNSAFVGFAQIHLEATRDIQLDSFTIWDLNGSTGISAPGSQVTLEAGRIIVLGDNSSLVAGPGWSARLAAGVDFSTAPHAVRNGVGGIYLNGGPADPAGGLPSGSGSLQTSDGSIFLAAGHEMLVGAGYIRTTGGGNIDITTGDGNVDAGIRNDHYVFQQNRYDLSSDLGGIGTAHGGNVTIRAGADILSFGSTLGAYSGFGLNQPGDVSLTAAGSIRGKFHVSNGLGSMQAGGDVGSDASAITLSIIKGAWDVRSFSNIYLNEVLNPNGVFNNNQIGGARYRFDYAPDASVSLQGNSVQLLGSALAYDRQGINRDRPPIYPPKLVINAAAGGLLLGNDVVLYPSALGALQISTVDGGSLWSTAGNYYQLIISDSGSTDYRTFASGHAATPLHLADNDPVTFMISGDLRNIFLRSPTRTEVSVGGNTLSFGFEGQNLSANDVSRISIAGDCLTRSDQTFVVLNDAPSQTVFDLIFVVPRFVPELELAAHLIYDAATRTLGFQGRMSTADRDFLLHPFVLSYDASGSLVVDANGNPILAPATFTTDAAAINTLYANSQGVPVSSLGYSGMQISGPGQLALAAQTLDLGTSQGVRSVGLLLNPALAGFSPQGADLNINLAGDLRMSSSQIASYSGGNIDAVVGGQADVGSDSFSSEDAPRGIYTAHGGHVALRTGADMIVRGSRVASYDGGDLLLRAGGNLDAGTGGHGLFFVTTARLNPATGQVEWRNDSFFGSGILAVNRPDSAAVVGNIFVQVERDLLVGCDGILQESFNASEASTASVDVAAGALWLDPSCGIVGANIINVSAAGPIAGILVAQPQSASITTAPGTDVTLAVTVTGLPPFSYQWSRGGTNLPGAGGPQLTLANVQMSDAGAYSVVVMNPWATKTNTIQLTVLDGRGMAASVLAEISALRPQIRNKQDREVLAKLLHDLADSLAGRFWIDQTHLQPKHGHKVFADWMETVQQLRDLQKEKTSPIPAATWQGFIDQIVGVARLVAATSIDDLSTTGIDAKDLADAKKELARGDRAVVKGPAEEGIEFYAKSWEATRDFVREGRADAKPPP